LTRPGKSALAARIQQIVGLKRVSSSSVVPMAAIRLPSTANAPSCKTTRSEFWVTITA
jgi:hypothetical protein